MVDLFRVFMAPEARQAALDVLTPDDQGRLYIGQGKRVDAFERELQSLFVSDVPILSTNSCTSAIDLALHLCGVRAHDYVISTPMTCSATNGGIRTRGARILWADVDPHTGCIDPFSVARLLRQRRLSPIKAIVAVDWAGRACDYDTLRGVADGLPIIEDAAHAPLANYRGRPISYMGGEYVCWSFGAIKHITAGDGAGALRVPEEHVERARLLRWHGLDRTKGESFRCAQNIAEAGYRYNLSDLNAAIGLANLEHLPHIVYQHRQNARAYYDALRGVPGITVPPPDAGSSWWLYCLLTESEAARDSLIAWLGARDIAASPVHARNDKHTGFGGPHHEGDLPGVDRFAATECAIPVGWWVTAEDRQKIVDAIKSWSVKGRPLNAPRALSLPPAARQAAQDAQEAEEAAVLA